MLPGRGVHGETVMTKAYAEDESEKKLWQLTVCNPIWLKERIDGRLHGTEVSHARLSNRMERDTFITTPIPWGENSTGPDRTSTDSCHGTLITIDRCPLIRPPSYTTMMCGRQLQDNDEDVKVDVKPSSSGHQKYCCVDASFKTTTKM